MAPNKTAKGKARLTPTASKTKKASSSSVPKPFKRAPDTLKPLLDTLPPNNAYVIHIDNRPVEFKRKIFSVPVGMNLAVVALLIWRMWVVVPWYVDIITSTLGYENATTVRAADLTNTEYAWVITRRGLSFFFDFIMAIFVWPWPYEFVFGAPAIGRGSPVRWRWAVGFHDREIYVRRSRPWYQSLGDDFLFAGEDAKSPFWVTIREATSSLLLSEKTGYLMMDGKWDLDWAGMVTATKLVDSKKIPLDTFTLLVLVQHQKYDDGNWLVMDLGPNGAVTGEDGDETEDEKRRKVFAFRNALEGIGQGDLFYRWIEIMQFEADRPGGFTPERQIDAAKQIRELFKSKGIDFDEFWAQSVKV
ncbi:hypothetical protein QBC35DRAFT_484784 [Podospora australis]|uniref:Uncharacterized protein n=1 Tax=Podospora australis TaxID=1536484 RepID=A0AAN6X531_9PEZI|nr:hypothetical protein QBC35DRAFT_484784 [Podospora australis]